MHGDQLRARQRRLPPPIAPSKGEAVRGDKQRRGVRDRAAGHGDDSAREPVTVRLRLLDPAQQQPGEQQRDRHIGRIRLGLRAEINERAAQCECRHCDRLAEFSQHAADDGGEYHERRHAGGERNRAQHQFAAAKAHHDFLREQKADGCALRVVERLRQLREGPVKDVARESRFIHPQRAVGEILDGAQ